MRTLLCCIGKMENAYIREFIDHYQKLGFTNVLLYDNNALGSERFEDSIDDFLKSGYVMMRNWRGKRVCQLDAYNTCYAEFQDKYDWIAFFDCDEFLFLNDGSADINEFLSNPRFSGFNMIHVNWKQYGDGGLLENDGRPLLERISVPLDLEHRGRYPFPDNNHIKTILRGGMEKANWEKNPHTPIMMIPCCNASGIQCNPISPFSQYDFSCAELRHYTTKTASEYADKIRRGFPDASKATPEMMLKLFFIHNKRTPEKEAIFRKKLGPLVRI